MLNVIADFTYSGQFLIKENDSSAMLIIDVAGGVTII